MPNTIELKINERGVFADGHEFGDSGAYERLSGRAYFAVDPTAAGQAPGTANIVDIQHAPLNDAGLVEFASDIFILKPLDPMRGNRRLFFDYGNRGNKRALQFFNDAPSSNNPKTLREAGNGYLMRRGYSIVWAAWQGDLLPGDGRMLLDLPVATENGQPITGSVRVEFIADRAGVTTFPLSGRASTRSHPSASLQTSEASLSKRRYATDKRIPVPADAWCFARIEGGAGLDNQGAETGLAASASHIHIYEGFHPGWIYELVYTARDPLVLGLAHVAVRDLISFLKYEQSDRTNNPNPLGAIDKAYAWGAFTDRSLHSRCYLFRI